MSVITPVKWGQKLGEGGEGSVYAYTEDTVAKIYSEVPDAERLERKLRALVAARTDRLEEAAAWPREILYEDSKPIGFTMQRLKDALPLHQVYQARSRQRLLPKADWAFLVRVARNLSACVHFVHLEGLVIGDLNESNALVGRDAMVRLIDADSFQLDRDGFLQTCDVGKSELLPPELQNTSLAGKRRSVEHDRFSLAVLVFQILIVGRHPFAGRPLTAKSLAAQMGFPPNIPAEVSLETAITKGWFAYADPPVGPILPPPGLDLNWLPEDVRVLCRRAFVGEPQQRPTAEEWYGALERMEGGLIRCESNDRHVFPNVARDQYPLTPSQRPQCPWCDLEKAWSTYLFVSAKPAEFGLSKDDIGQIVREIEAIHMEPVKRVPKLFLDINAKKDDNWFIVFWPTWLAYHAIQFATKGGVGALFVVIVVLAAGSLAVASGLTRRRARGIAEPLAEKWKVDGVTTTFDQAKAAALEAAKRYQDGDLRRDLYRLEILRWRHGDNLKHHLGKYSILAADVPTVGYSRLEALHRLGVLTAADLTRERFNDGIWSQTHIDELMAWRNSLELQFWATSSYRVTDREEADIRAKVNAEQHDLERQVKHAPEQLQKLADTLYDRRRQVIDQLHRELQPLQKNFLSRRILKSINGYEVPDTTVEERPLPARR